MSLPELYHVTVEVLQADAVAPPVDMGILGLPHAHVEGDDGDTDVLSCFTVDIGELQPGMILLLPGP